MIAKPNAVKITNSNDDSIEFGHHFKLIGGLNLSALQANVAYAQTTKDGASYQRTILSVRDFDLTFSIDRKYREAWWVEEQRALAYRVFNPNFNSMRIEFTTKAGQSFYLTAELLAAPVFIDDTDNDNKIWLKGLLQFNAGDPYIYNAAATYTDLATWVPNFEFPLEIPDGEGIEMGYRDQNLIANVFNDGSSASGMIVRYRALATVINPKIINVSTFEELQLNVEMLPGDIVEVNTHVGQKSATLIRNNVKTDVFNIVDLNSTFLQLLPGDNIFRYDAASGLDYLDVQIIFTAKRIGV